MEVGGVVDLINNQYYSVLATILPAKYFLLMTSSVFVAWLEGRSRDGQQAAFGVVRIGRGTTALMDRLGAHEPSSGMPSTAGFKADLTVAGCCSDWLSPARNSATVSRIRLSITHRAFGGFQVDATAVPSKQMAARLPLGPEMRWHPNTLPKRQRRQIRTRCSATCKRGPAAAIPAYERNPIEIKIKIAAVALQQRPASCAALMRRKRRATEMYIAIFFVREPTLRRHVDTRPEMHRRITAS